MEKFIYILRDMCCAGNIIYISTKINKVIKFRKSYIDQKDNYHCDDDSIFIYKIPLAKYIEDDDNYIDDTPFLSIDNKKE